MTWSLVGVELDHPVLTEKSRAPNLANEGGVDGHIRYRRNVMGLGCASGLLAGDLEALRGLVRATQAMRRFEPRTSTVRQER